jgi:hypothetical protein
VGRICTIHYRVISGCLGVETDCKLESTVNVIRQKMDSVTV